MFDTLITPQQLQDNIDRCCVFDCRFNLADVDHGRRAFELAHIPGAYFLDLNKDLSSPVLADTGRHPLPDPQILADLLHRAGLRPDTQAVVYDDAGGATAARTWWLLRWLGHQSVAVLDGGFPAWQAAGFAVTAAYKKLSEEPDSVQARVDRSQMRSTADVVNNLDTQAFTLVDARAAERYKGEVEPIDPVAGHIPHALNRPLTDNLQDGKFKHASILREEWLQVLKGHAPENIVHMCGSGVTACHNQLAMEIAGLHGSRVYVGSWSEWIRDPSRPIASAEK